MTVELESVSPFHDRCQVCQHLTAILATFPINNFRFAISALAMFAVFSLQLVYFHFSRRSVDMMRFWVKSLHRPEAFITITSTNVLWIRNCSAYSEPMTSQALDRRAGSRRTLLHMQQRAAGGHYGRHLERMKSWKSDSVNRRIFILEEQSCQMSSRSDLKRRSLGLFWRASPQNSQQEQQE